MTDDEPFMTGDVRHCHDDLNTWDIRCIIYGTWTCVIAASFEELDSRGLCTSGFRNLPVNQTLITNQQPSTEQTNGCNTKFNHSPAEEGYWIHGNQLQ